MAGWRAYNEHTGEVESGLYERPFIVRGKFKTPLTPDTTISAFRTRNEAEEWLMHHQDDYMVGESGFASLHIENWNEDDPAKLAPWERGEECGPDGYVHDGADKGL